MALPGQQSYAPARPPTERDTVHALNGTPVFLGAIASTGTALNNSNTATPFNSPAPGTQGGLNGTLAGRVLLIQSTTVGFVLPSTSAVPALLVAIQTIPPVGGTAPGVILAANTPQIILMSSNCGWLQYIPTGAAAGNLLVWELI